MTSLLSALRALEQAATPLPWTASKCRDHHQGRVECSDGSKLGELATFGCGPYEGHGLDNAALVVALRNAAPALLKVAEAADKLRKARDERHQRAHDLQAMAAKARAGGPSGAGALAEYDRTHPTVWDIGDVTEEICEALDALDTEESK